jgi:O-antigen/teichoic acid export membrane protein
LRTAQETIIADAPSGVSTARGYIRGSSLLLGGRFISIALNFAVQVLTVRYLSQSDYGAFAYALGIVSMGSSILLMGLGKAVPRFIPIYLQRGDHARAYGTIALAISTVWGLGLSAIVITVGMRSLLDGPVVTDPLSMSLLLILIALAPITASDNLLQHLVAVFAKPRAIFFRRHVVGPGLKLAAILVVIAMAGDVRLLAYGYLAGGLAGAFLYVAILLREWKRQKFWQHLDSQGVRYPAQELFGFSLPLLSSELPVIVRGTLAIILLEFLHNTVAVAEYRAVLPVAGLNMLVFEAFALLFVPLASRMFAMNDSAGIRSLYWQTSTLLVVLTFPVFAATFALAEPVTVLLFGAEYAGTGVVLAVLAVGFYMHAAMGFNSATLRVHGKVRHIVAADVSAALLFVVASLLLIPQFAALGAAFATTVAMVGHNLANQLMLVRSGTGVGVMDSQFRAVLGAAIAAAIALYVIQWLYAPPLLIGLVVTASLAVALVRATRRATHALEIFPELGKVPLLRWLLT